MFYAMHPQRCPRGGLHRVAAKSSEGRFAFRPAAGEFMKAHLPRVLPAELERKSSRPCLNHEVEGYHCIYLLQLSLCGVDRQRADTQRQRRSRAEGLGFLEGGVMRGSSCWQSVSAPMPLSRARDSSADGPPSKYPPGQLRLDHHSL